VAALPAVRQRLTWKHISSAAAGMTTTSHLVCLFCVTAGQNGENLGSDEEQVVLFVYLLYDIANNKVGHRAQFSPFRCRSSVVASPLCRCKIPLFCKKITQEKSVLLQP